MNLRALSDPSLARGFVASIMDAHDLPVSSSIEPSRVGRGSHACKTSTVTTVGVALSRILDLGVGQATVIPSDMPTAILARANEMTGRVFRAIHKIGRTWIVERLS